LRASRGSDDTRELVARAQQGDDEAFRKLVRVHYDRIHRWALALTGDEDDADDVIQLALLKFYRTLQDYRGQAQLTTWLYTILRSSAGELLRSSTRRSRLAEKASHLEVPEVRVPDPASTVAQERLAELALEFYRELPDRQREVFDLVDLQGYTPSEAAELMGARPVTVRSHLLHARRTIRSRLLQLSPEITEDYRS
jgi:RNA polymerase sigma-70 factor (ECF subfamily)